MTSPRRNCAVPAVIAIVALAATGPLYGCAAPDKFPPACPGLAMLPDAADLTRYANGGRDLSDLVIDAKITAVPASCTRKGGTVVQATLNVSAQVTRGPALHAARVNLPYFVAVMEGQTVLDEQDYQLLARFPGNLDQDQPTGEDIVLNLPVTKQKSAAAYRILVGFRLSQDELALNRQRGPR